MRRQCSVLLALSTVLLFGSLASAQVSWHQLDCGEGGTLEYAQLLPPDYDAAKTYPVLLAMPPGAQDRSMVEAGLSRYWGDQASDRGWVVVSPVAPEGARFFGDADRLIAPLLVKIRETFRVALGRMHLAGASNGGISACHVAIHHPFEFQSLTVLPGYVPEQDIAFVKRLRWMRVRQFVGSEDGRWVDRSRATHAALQEAGIDAQLTVLDGDGHVPASLDGGVIMDSLVELHTAAEWSGPEAAVHRVLDDFNDAAAKADEDRYFGHFAPEGVFLGTDPGERWDLDQFSEFAWPYFTERDSAWIFIPQHRWVTLTPDGSVAWFHEKLGSANYGECRGTGTLRKVDGEWRVTLYDLTTPVPNDLMSDVVQQIRDHDDGKQTSPASPPQQTTIFLVRHAEKVVDPNDRDPGLTEEGTARAERLARMLARSEVSAAYVTEYRRTRDTLLPLCDEAGIEPTTIGARDSASLIQALTTQHGGETVVVAGHSNTVPSIIRALGVETDLKLTEKDYSGLFVVTLGAGTPRLTILDF